MSDHLSNRLYILIRWCCWTNIRIKNLVSLRGYLAATKEHRGRAKVRLLVPYENVGWCRTFWHIWPATACNDASSGLWLTTHGFQVNRGHACLLIFLIHTFIVSRQPSNIDIRWAVRMGQALCHCIVGTDGWRNTHLAFGLKLCRGLDLVVAQNLSLAHRFNILRLRVRWNNRYLFRLLL